jgi:putative Holliday junction resolvase
MTTILDDVRALKTRLERGKRLLGLDVGSKTIGLALSDVSLLVATPHSLIRRTKFTKDAAALGAVIVEQDVGGLVLGLPVGMDGREGPACQSVRAFAANLAGALAARGLGHVAIAFWDERLSTAAVERMLVGEADLSRARRKEVVDKVAAAYILQGALDALRQAPPQSS